MEAQTYKISFTSEGENLLEGDLPSEIVQDTVLRAVESLLPQLNWIEVPKYFYTEWNDGLWLDLYAVGDDGEGNNEHVLVCKISVPRPE